MNGRGWYLDRGSYGLKRVRSIDVERELTMQGMSPTHAARRLKEHKPVLCGQYLYVWHERYPG